MSVNRDNVNLEEPMALPRPESKCMLGCSTEHMSVNRDNVNVEEPRPPIIFKGSTKRGKITKNKGGGNS